MTDLIQEVKAALQAATPGPWENEAGTIWAEGVAIAQVGVIFGSRKFDGNLIANSPTWLQKLIDMVEELEEELNQERSGRESKSEMGQVNP
jgi:hypothetical protein